MSNSNQTCALLLFRVGSNYPITRHPWTLTPMSLASLTRSGRQNLSLHAYHPKSRTHHAKGLGYKSFLCRTRIFYLTFICSSLCLKKQRQPIHVPPASSPWIIRSRSACCGRLSRKALLAVDMFFFPEQNLYIAVYGVNAEILTATCYVSLPWICAATSNRSRYLAISILQVLVASLPRFTSCASLVRTTPMVL